MFSFFLDRIESPVFRIWTRAGTVFLFVQSIREGRVDDEAWDETSELIISNEAMESQSEKIKSSEVGPGEGVS